MRKIKSDPMRQETKDLITQVLDESEVMSCLVIVRPFFREILLENINNTELYLSMHPRSISHSTSKEYQLNTEHPVNLMQANIKVGDLMNIQSKLSDFIQNSDLEACTFNYQKSN